MKNNLIVLGHLLPVIFSLLLLSAHFSRANITLISYVFLILPFVLFIRHSLTARTMQIILILGTLEWIRTLYALAAYRISEDQPYIRLVIILVMVALFTLTSALVFFSDRLKDHYQLRMRSEE